MMNKYFVFRKLLDFVADYFDYKVTDADMNNYSGDIEITGTDGDGSTIQIRATLMEGNNNA